MASGHDAKINLNTMVQLTVTMVVKRDDVDVDDDDDEMGRNVSLGR
jgi:hypothetical protein